MKTMQDHANKEHDQTFLIMFIMISAHLLTVTKDDIQKLDLISLTCRRLLCLVTQVTQVEGKSKLLQV